MKEGLVILLLVLFAGGVWLTDFLAESWDWPHWQVGLLLVGVLLGALIGLFIVGMVLAFAWLFLVIIGVYLAASIATVWYDRTEDMEFRKAQARIRNMSGWE